MQRYILRRFFQSVLALLALSMLIFLMSRLTGDPTMLMLPDDASQEDIAQLRHALGLDQPLPVQYWVFLSRAVLGQSLPQFWVGIVLIQIFAVHLRWLPVAGVGSVWHYVLPSFTLGWFVVAGMMRLLRSSMLDIMGSEFVKF